MHLLGASPEKLVQRGSASGGSDSALLTQCVSAGLALRRLLTNGLKTRPHAGAGAAPDANAGYRRICVNIDYK